MENLEEWCGPPGVSSYSSSSPPPPDITKFFPRLETLRIQHCAKLATVPSHLFSFQELTSLRWLLISYCNNLRSLKGLLHQTLVTLEISKCPNLIMDPDELRSLTSVQKLGIVGCPGLANFLVDIPLICLTSLRELTIGYFSEELEYFPWPSCSSSTIVKSDVVASTTTAEEVDDKKCHPHPKHYPFISLKSLTLLGWRRCKNLPNQLQHLTALRELSINCFFGLVALPEWLGNLSSLHYLKLCDCESLMNLPTLEAMQRLTNLRSLRIVRCHLLEERCARESTYIPSINWG